MHIEMTIKINGQPRRVWIIQPPRKFSGPEYGARLYAAKHAPIRDSLLYGRGEAA